MQLDEAQPGSGAQRIGRRPLLGRQQRRLGRLLHRPAAGWSPAPKPKPGAPDLYRYDFSKPPGSRLTDLTKGAVAGRRQRRDRGQRRRLVRLLRRRRGADPRRRSKRGRPARRSRQGQPLRLRRGEGKTSFIAQLADQDNLDWAATAEGDHRAGLPRRPAPRPSSRSKAKRSTGYDNLLAANAGKFAGTSKCKIEGRQLIVGNPLCPEAFLYDKQTQRRSPAPPATPPARGRWARRSCRAGPTCPKARASSPTTARRLFFETYDRLLPGDENNQRDVYEFERPGNGRPAAPRTPTTTRPRAAATSSSPPARSPDESFLVDASATAATSSSRPARP